METFVSRVTDGVSSSKSLPLMSYIGIFILKVHFVFYGTSAVTVRSISYALKFFKFVGFIVHVKAVMPPLRLISTLSSKLPEKKTGSENDNINV